MSQQQVVALLRARDGRGTIPSIARDGLSAGYWGSWGTAVLLVRRALVQMERHGEVRRHRPPQRRGVEHVWEIVGEPEAPA